MVKRLTREGESDSSRQSLNLKIYPQRFDVSQVKRVRDFQLRQCQLKEG